MNDIQACGSSDGAHKGTEPHHTAGGGEQEGHKGRSGRMKRLGALTDF
jgi:hypothetical protein